MRTRGSFPTRLKIPEMEGINSWDLQTIGGKDGFSRFELLQFSPSSATLQPQLILPPLPPPAPRPSSHSPSPFSLRAQLEGSPLCRILLPPTNQPLTGPKAGALQTLPIPSPSHAAGVPPPAPSLPPRLAGIQRKSLFIKQALEQPLSYRPKQKILLNCLPPSKPCHAKPCLRAPQPALLGGGWVGDQTVNPPQPIPPSPRRLP